MTTGLIWFRNDLRLFDNPALFAACAECDEVVPVFILDDDAAGNARLGGAARWWLHHSLTALAEDLDAKGATLVFRRGDAVKIVQELAAQAGAGAVYVARAHEPAPRAMDRALTEAFKDRDIAYKPYLSASLFAPESVKTKADGFFNVFTPFQNACMAKGVDDHCLPAPETIPGGHKLRGDKLADWALLPTRPDWAGGMRAAWEPGEAGGQKLLDRFVDGPIARYDVARNLPGDEGTSRLSPYLHYGEVSPRDAWRRAAQAGHGKGAQTFLRELIWRDFCIHLLWQHPGMKTEPIRPEFAKMQWRDDKAGLEAWQSGRTGIPIVDAGMRQLWQTGWMHNRVRMIAASFLIKHQLIAWQAGEAWFWDTLCEADLPSNAGNWQWVAGCGADAAPFFRVFNPVLQSHKFDADGGYIREYVPELAKLPAQHIHAPWEAEEAVLSAAGVTLGETYPRPVVKLEEGRARALQAFRRLRGKAAG